MIIILAVLALVVVKALTNSPWGVFSIAATVPIAIFMGIYMRFIRPGKIAEVSIIGFVLDDGWALSMVETLHNIHTGVHSLRFQVLN